MSKQAAFGTALSMGTRQVESMTITGAADAGGGDFTLTLTATGVAGVVITVTVAALDDVGQCAEKARVAARALTTITNFCEVGGTGATISFTMLLAAANNAAMAIVFDAGTSGCTAGASTDTTAGVAYAAVAAIKGLTGPSLKLDTADVTSHDSTGGWEQVVGTVLREGSVKLDLVYDPAENTHDATEVGGLAYLLKTKTNKGYKITWPDTTIWYFPAFVEGFEPGAPVDGALTATVSLRISGRPILA
jgi:predicted secreted protein